MKFDRLLSQVPKNLLPAYYEAMKSSLCESIIYKPVYKDDEVVDIINNRWSYRDSQNHTARIGTINVVADLATYVLPCCYGFYFGAVRESVALGVVSILLAVILLLVIIFCHAENDVSEQSCTLGNIQPKFLLSHYLDKIRFKKIYTTKHNEFLTAHKEDIHKHNRLVEFKQTSGVTTIESTIFEISKDISQLNSLSSQIGQQLHQNNVMIEKVKSSRMSNDITAKVVEKLESTNKLLTAKREEIDACVVSKKNEARQFTITAEELSNCWLLLDATNCIELSESLLGEAKVAIDAVTALKVNTSLALTEATREVHSFLTETSKVLA